MNKMSIDDPTAPRLLSEAESRRVIAEIKDLCPQDGGLSVTVLSWWAGGQRWARNRASMTSDQRDVRVLITRRLRKAQASVTANKLDRASLRAAVNLVEHYCRRWAGSSRRDMPIEPPLLPSPGASVWSDHTFNRTADENGRAVMRLTQRAEEHGLLSAGYLETGGAHAVKYERDEWGRTSDRVGQVTQAQCSVTVRHPQGTGSGWAGNTSFDLARIDPAKIAKVAFDKCLASVNPVRIEPGRYQTILEPQAAATFFQLLVESMRRLPPEQSASGPFFLGPDGAVNRLRSKIGLKVVDERITITHDPADPLVGTHADPGFRKVTLVDRGILTALYNGYKHAVNELYDIGEQSLALPRTSFAVQGTTTTLEEMIHSTKRGLLVTRVSLPQLINGQSLLYTGVTRDGLWLIENGKITKAVRNFRWTESPLFIFNNLEEIGVAVPTYDPVNIRSALTGSFANSLNNVVVPAVKVNDFSFTSTIDAI
jgi:predicted Zn-dependent protease